MNISTIDSSIGNTKKTKIISVTGKLTNINVFTDAENFHDNRIGAVLGELEHKAREKKAKEVMGVRFLNIKNSKGDEVIMAYGTAIFEE